MKSGEKGFTLVELIIAVSIMVLVSASAGSGSLSGGYAWVVAERIDVGVVAKLLARGI